MVRTEFQFLFSENHGVTFLFGVSFPIISFKPKLFVLQLRIFNYSTKLLRNHVCPRNYIILITCFLRCCRSGGHCFIYQSKLFTGIIVIVLGILAITLRNEWKYNEWYVKLPQYPCVFGVNLNVALRFVINNHNYYYCMI